MPSLLNTNSVMMCPHGGQVQPISSNTRAQAGGAFLLRASDTFMIAGCPFNIGVSPHPFFAVTGDDGSFTLKGVPPGTYTVEAVHEKYGRKEGKLTLAPNGSATLECTSAATFRPGSAMPGMPASETSTTCAPSRASATSSGARRASWRTSTRRP